MISLIEYMAEHNRRKAIELIQTQKWDYFLTLELREPKYSERKVQFILYKFLRLLKRYYFGHSTNNDIIIFPIVEQGTNGKVIRLLVQEPDNTDSSLTSKISQLRRNVVRAWINSDVNSINPSRNKLARNDWIKRTRFNPDIIDNMEKAVDKNPENVLWDLIKNRH